MNEKELNPVEVADEIKAVMEDENFIPDHEDIECYGKHQIKPSDILPCPFCGSEHLQFGDWGTHGAYDKVACGNGCTDWIPVERWNNRPAEEALQKRISELEQMAEVRKSANRLLEQERNELEAERDHFREVAKKLVWLYSDEYSEKRDNGLRIEGFYSHEWLDMILDMARKTLKGAGNNE